MKITKSISLFKRTCLCFFDISPLSETKTLYPFCFPKIAVPTPLSPPPRITRRPRTRLPEGEKTGIVGLSWLLILYALFFKNSLLIVKIGIPRSREF